MDYHRLVSVLVKSKLSATLSALRQKLTDKFDRKGYPFLCGEIAKSAEAAEEKPEIMIERWASLLLFFPVATVSDSTNDHWDDRVPLST